MSLVSNHSTKWLKSWFPKLRKGIHSSKVCMDNLKILEINKIIICKFWCHAQSDVKRQIVFNLRYIDLQNILRYFIMNIISKPFNKTQFGSYNLHRSIRKMNMLFITAWLFIFQYTVIFLRFWCDLYRDIEIQWNFVYIKFLRYSIWHSW